MDPYTSFFNSWDYFMALGAYVLMGLGVLIFLYHQIRIISIKDYKEKYDYVNLYEVRFFWYCILAIILGGAFLVNSIATEMIISGGTLWFFVRIFITVCFTIIAYFVFFNMVRIYYPQYVERKLQRLRNKPRLSPTGNHMRKLSEEEEDAHLEESQIAEEANIHAVDYDVWLDEKTGFKKVEKYLTYQHAKKCPDCGYYTFKIDREEIQTAPTPTTSGLIYQYYHCHYCNHREIRQVTLTKTTDNIQ